VADDRQRQGQFEKQAADDEYRHGSHGEGQVLPNDRRRPAGKPVRVGEPPHVFREQRHIGGLKRDI